MHHTRIFSLSGWVVEAPPRFLDVDVDVNVNVTVTVWLRLRLSPPMIGPAHPPSSMPRLLPSDNRRSGHLLIYCGGSRCICCTYLPVLASPFLTLVCRLPQRTFLPFALFVGSLLAFLFLVHSSTIPDMSRRAMAGWGANIAKPRLIPTYTDTCGHSESHHPTVATYCVRGTPPPSPSHAVPYCTSMTNLYEMR
ncbi:hypothetical protein OH76DRAFT_706563 [Lentinus brumalis]|uniref:Uncharacterized protein n=1 Tax=Lentinus brumalis TaxID=2498619 RepID=A0A371D5U8_9APHY|nr:hypothetical protein OH76DRAFT_706563 [Polyporus brumalis]